MTPNNSSLKILVVWLFCLGMQMKQLKLVKNNHLFNCQVVENLILEHVHYMGWQHVLVCVWKEFLNWVHLLKKYHGFYIRLLISNQFHLWRYEINVTYWKLQFQKSLAFLKQLFYKYFSSLRVKGFQIANPFWYLLSVFLMGVTIAYVNSLPVTFDLYRFLGSFESLQPVAK